MIQLPAAGADAQAVIVFKLYRFLVHVGRILDSKPKEGGSSPSEPARHKARRSNG